MTRPTRAKTILVIATVFSWTPFVSALAQVIVQVDHRNGAVTIADSPARSAVEVVDARTLRFRKATSVHLQVVNGNTALYEYSISTENAPLDVPNTPSASLQPIGAFLATIRTLMPEVNLLLSPARGASRGASMLPSTVPTLSTAAATAAMAEALQNGRAVEADLLQVDNALRGPNGVSETLGMTVRALGRMRHGDVEGQAKALADSLHLPTQSCGEPAALTSFHSVQPASIDLGGKMLEALQALKSDNDVLVGTLSNPLLRGDSTTTPLTAPLRDLRARSDSALKNSDAIVSSAYQVEQLASSVTTACSHWDAPSFSISSGAPQIATIKIKARSGAEVQRLAVDVPSAISVRLLPPPDRVVTKLGVGVMYAPHAHYPTYDLRTVGGTGAQNLIYESTPVDDRFSYGLTLSTSVNPWMGWSNFSLWLPELTIADPGISSRNAIGLGFAISYRSVKLGTGGFWVKHQILDTLGVGKALPNASFLKRHDGYGSSIPYFSITVFNLAELLGISGTGSASGGGAPTKPSDSRPSKP